MALGENDVKVPPNTPRVKSPADPFKRDAIEILTLRYPLGSAA